MQHIIELLPYLFMSAWAVFAVFYILKARRQPESINMYMLESIPQIFATIGILGTFMGIAYGLSSFDVKKIEASIPELLDGLRTAFYASIAGIILLIVSSKFIEHSQKRIEKLIPTDEAVALTQIVALLTDLNEKMSNNYEYTLEINRKLESVNTLADLGSQVIELNRSLKQLSTDLTATIDAGFENILIQQEKNNTVPHLQRLQEQVDGLSLKIDQSSAEITQALVNELAAKFEKIVEEFRQSISDSAKAELENIINYLRQTGRALAEFPARFQAMSETMTKNFNQLQEMLKQTTIETLSQTNESTAIMRKQIDEMSQIVKYFYTIYS